MQISSHFLLENGRAEHCQILILRSRAAARRLEG
jgi:hypothetical protein